MAGAQRVLALLPGSLIDPTLMVLAQELSGYERTRIATGNRLRLMVKPSDEADEDGECRGLGLPGDHPSVGAITFAKEGLEAVEHAVALALVKQLRLHPLYAWVKAQHGLGAKTVARLLGTIGDPYWNFRDGRARTVSQLWAYCGLHVVEVGGGSSHVGSDAHCASAGSAPRRVAGQRANWSTEARTRLFVMAEACVRQDGEPDKNGKTRKRSQYRDVYDAGRAKYLEAVHSAPCVRCGTRGKPAAPGTPINPSHQHARAMRLVMKRILLDLWCEAKRIHQDAEGPGPASGRSQTFQRPGSSVQSNPNPEATAR